jgi:uroporphyrinogen-III synthase
LTGPVPVVAPLFSPRTAILFAEQVKSAANLHVVAMSAAVVEALGGITPKSVQTAAIPTGTEMRRCVENLLSGATLP